MSTFSWISLTVAVVLAFAAWGQAGDLPWGSGLYRIRPEGSQESGRSGTSWPVVIQKDGGKVVVPQTRQKSVRPWGEVPLEWQDEVEQPGGAPQFREDDGRGR